MKNRPFCFYFLVLSLVGCTPYEDKWLIDYQHTKCAYCNLEKSLKADSVQIFDNNEEYKRLRTEVDFKSSAYLYRIAFVKKKIKEENKAFQVKYRDLADKHNSKYGHVSTSAYERAVAELQNKRAETINKYKEEINRIEQEKVSDTLLQDLLGKIDNLNLLFEKKKKKALVTKDSLQKELNELNQQRKYLERQLDEQNLKIFKEKTDSIRLNPCTFKVE